MQTDYTLPGDHGIVTAAVSAAKAAGNREEAIRAAVERLPSDPLRREALLREVVACIDCLFKV